MRCPTSCCRAGISIRRCCCWKRDALVQFLLYLAVLLANSSPSPAANKEEQNLVIMKKMVDVSLFTKACTGVREIDKGVCIGYVMGVADALSSSNSLFGVTACMPDGATVDDLLKIAMHEVDKFANSPHIAVAPIIASAYAKQYSC